MFGLSVEHLLIAAVVLIFFGPRHLPRAGAVLGKTIRGFRESYNGNGGKVIEAEYRRESDKETTDADRAS